MQKTQVQERLTMQIVQELQKVLNTDDVACILDAKHLCVIREELETLKAALLLLNLVENSRMRKQKESF
jgi:GTP cyclohydrolase I